jgi:hypothetical protein
LTAFQSSLEQQQIRIDGVTAQREATEADNRLNNYLDVADSEGERLNLKASVRRCVGFESLARMFTQFLCQLESFPDQRKHIGLIAQRYVNYFPREERELLCCVGIPPKEFLADFTANHGCIALVVGRSRRKKGRIPVQRDPAPCGGYWDFFASEEVELPRRPKD